MVLLSALFGVFIAMFGISGFTILIPIWKTHWNLAVDQVQWSLIGFMAAAGASMPLSGYAMNRWGIRRVFTCVTLLYALISSIGIFVTAWELILAIRVMTGLCAGLLTPLTISMLYKYIPDKQRAVAMGWWSMAAMLGPAVGPVISGWLHDRFGWSSIFAFSLPLCIVIIACLQFIPDDDPSSSPLRLPYRDLLFACGGSIGILIGLSQVHRWGADGWLYGLLTLAGVLLLSRLIQLSKGRQSLLLWTLFKQKIWMITMLWNGIVTLALYAGTFLMPLYLMDVQGWSAADSGWIMLLPSIVMVLLAPLVGRLYDVVGPLKLMFVGWALMLIGSMMLAMMGSSSTLYTVIGGMLIRSVGISFVTTPGNHLNMECLDSRDVAHGSALSNWLKQILSACSIAIYSAVVMAGQSPVNSIAVPVSQIQLAFWVSIIFIVALVPMWLMLVRVKKMGMQTPSLNSEQQQLSQ